MKTSQLIAALSADPVPQPVHIGRRVWAALTAGLIISLIFFALFVGLRPDLAAAVRTVRFDLKFLAAAALLLPSLLLLLRLSRPDAKPGALPLGLFAPVLLLAVAVVIELMVTPSGEWLRRLIGVKPLYCVTVITMLAAPPLAGLVAALRAAAPMHSGWSGALAGATAAGIASLVFAAHCPNDSPLFVATWHPLATLICGTTGALAGRRFLAW